jgi:hypothetical protein
MIKGYEVRVHYRGCTGQFCSITFRVISHTNNRIIQQLCKKFDPISILTTKKNLSEWLTDHMTRDAWWHVVLYLLEPRQPRSSLLKRYKHILDGTKRCISNVAFEKERTEDELH